MGGSTEVVDLLLKTGAVMDYRVIKPSVKLRQLNVKLFQATSHFSLKQKM